MPSSRKEIEEAVKYFERNKDFYKAFGIAYDILSAYLSGHIGEMISEDEIADIICIHWGLAQTGYNHRPTAERIAHALSGHIPARKDALTKEEFHSILCEFPPSIAKDSGQPEWTQGEIDRVWDFITGKYKFIEYDRSLVRNLSREEVIKLIEDNTKHQPGATLFGNYKLDKEGLADAILSSCKEHIPARNLSREELMEIIDKAIEPRLEYFEGRKDFLYPTHSFKVYLADAILSSGKEVCK